MLNRIIQKILFALPFCKLQKTKIELLVALANATELKDSYMRGHSQRTAAMAFDFAKFLGLKRSQLRKIYEGALLHDIGKMGIPDEILLKDGALTDEERKIIQSHPKISEKIFGESCYFSRISEIPLYHHERWDGSGYPFGLKKENIPLPARIFMIIDTWDALVSPRVYKKAISPREAVKIIVSESGQHFDPKIVSAFIDYLEKKQIVEKNFLNQEK